MGAGDVFHALADSNRRHLIDLLAERENATATELATILPVTRQAVTKHLAELKAAGLVDVRKVGREARYSLTPAPLSDAVDWMASIGAEWDDRLNRLRHYLERERGR